MILVSRDFNCELHVKFIKATAHSLIKDSLC